MITDAMHTPTTIAPKAFFQSMPRRDATRAPVQAPVPGSGIPTKSTNPQNSYLPITFAHRFFLQLFYKRTEKARLA